MRKIFGLLLLILVTPSCEKDDICGADTPTTPRLVVEFYDNTNVLKAVTNLKVIAEGQENGIVFNPTGTDVTRYLTSARKISIPLDTSADTIKYQFILNAASPDPGLIYTDTLQFNYSRQTVFISRACGYNVVYHLNNSVDLPNPYVLNNDPNAFEGSWIQNIDIENYNLISENETHVKIYW